MITSRRGVVEKFRRLPNPARTGDPVSLVNKTIFVHTAQRCTLYHVPLDRSLISTDVHDIRGVIPISSQGARTLHVY